MKKSLTLALSSVTALLTLWSAPSVAQSTEPPPTPEAVQTVVQSQINLLHINTASAAEIQDKLIGIGAKKAQAIVDYREKHGKFIHIEQLTEVSGIGKATLDKNRDRIVLD